MSNHDLDKSALAISVEQSKARLALDILRYINRSDGSTEHHLHELAGEFLIEHFGGLPEEPNLTPNED